MRLSSDGYEQTTRKLANLKARLAAAENRTASSAAVHDQVVRSYQAMMRKYLRDIKLYEASLRGRDASEPADTAVTEG